MPSKAQILPLCGGGDSINYAEERPSSLLSLNDHDGKDKNSEIPKKIVHHDTKASKSHSSPLLQPKNQKQYKKELIDDKVNNSKSNIKSSLDKTEVLPIYEINNNDDVVHFDNSGRTVQICQQIGQGGFGTVYKTKLIPQRAEHCNDISPGIAFVTANSSSKSTGTDSSYFALKRIDCTKDQDGKLLEQCWNEVQIHQKLFDVASDENYKYNTNVIKLIDFKVETVSDSSSTKKKQKTFFNMLFPFYDQSLEEDLIDRHLMEDVLESQRNPYSTIQILELFLGIVHGVQALHEIVGVCHGDIKIENILLQGDNNFGRGDIGNSLTPILMDFGSCKPLMVPLHSCQDIMNVWEQALHDTTMSYRAPELWKQRQELHRRISLRTEGPPKYFDYGRADVWSLGCVLFAMCYGATPCEIEWSISFAGNPADATVRYKNCSFRNDDRSDMMIDNSDDNDEYSLLPNFPPDGSAADGRYGKQVKDLIQWILQPSRTCRPTSKELGNRVERLLRECKHKK